MTGGGPLACRSERIEAKVEQMEDEEGCTEYRVIKKEPANRYLPGERLLLKINKAAKKAKAKERARREKEQEEERPPLDMEIIQRSLSDIVNQF
jgi:hypothetical protein